uniref:Putative secreted protein n=1 Tax=Anopheles darlingi TaxID=43151 RepID=A0A2M4D779_ANODA
MGTPRTHPSPLMLFLTFSSQCISGQQNTQKKPSRKCVHLRNARWHVRGRTAAGQHYVTLRHIITDACTGAIGLHPLGDRVFQLRFVPPANHPTTTHFPLASAR